MNIEQVTKNNVGNISDSELRNLRNRAVQVYDRTELGRQAIAKRTVGISQPVPRDLFLDSYRLIRDEMEKRGLSHKRDAIDSKLVRKDLRGVDVSELPPIMLQKDAVCLTGQFVADPKKTNTVGVWMADGIPIEMEKRMAEAILYQTDRDVAVVDNLAAPAITAYDLMLIPRGETKDVDMDVIAKAQRVPISKPYPNEHAARQLDPKQFQEFRREKDKFGPGIDAIWGIDSNGKAKLQSIRFDSSKFTVAQARKWLKDHGKKTVIEPAKKSNKVKKIEIGKFTKVDEEERIVGGIVYAPDEVDSQGDYTDADEIWNALKGYMINTGGVMKIMHKGKEIDAPVVEVFQAEADTMKGGSHIPAGAWYQANYIPEEMDDVWNDIRDGRLTGYSMAGNAEVEGEG